MEWWYKYMIDYREGGQVVKHVYAFKSQRVKDNWLRTLRFAKTKIGKDITTYCLEWFLGVTNLIRCIASPNGLTWYLSSDQYEEEESVVVHDRRLPLYLSNHRIAEVEESASVSNTISDDSNISMSLRMHMHLCVFVHVSTKHQVILSSSEKMSHCFHPLSIIRNVWVTNGFCR